MIEAYDVGRTDGIAEERARITQELEAYLEFMLKHVEITRPAILGLMFAIQAVKEDN